MEPTAEKGKEDTHKEYEMTLWEELTLSNLEDIITQCTTIAGHIFSQHKPHRENQSPYS